MRGQSREEACRARITAAAGREFSEDETIELMEAVQARTNRYRNAGETPEAAALRAGTELAAEARTKAIVEKRNRAINVQRRKGLEARRIPGDEANTLLAAQGGSARGGRGFGYSAQAVGKEKYESMIRDLETDLTRANLMHVLKNRDPQFEEQFTNELWHVEDPAVERPAVHDPDARKAAEIFGKHQELLRLALNEAGAWIGKLDHYVTRQSHDMWKIRRENFEAWRDFILPKLSERTFDHLADPAKREEFLHDVWTGLRSGVHERNNGADWLGGFTGPANMAKRLSQERVLHFKGPKEFFEYNQRFGHGSVIGSILQSFERGAMNLGAMKVFGTNPASMINAVRRQWASAAARAGNDRIADRLRSKEFDRLTGMLTGEANQPEGKHLAQWAQTLRQWKNTASLGFSMIKSMPDLGSNASMLRANGMNYFQSIFHQLAAILPETSEARRLALLQMYGGVKGTLADVGARYRAEDSKAGHLSSASNLEFTLSGLNWWTRTQRNGAGSGLGALWAEHIKAPFEKLPWEAHNILKRFDLDDEGSWRALQQVKTADVDGDHFLFPGEILNLPDEAVAHLGPNPERARQDLKSRFGTLYSDQIGEAMSEPTWRQRSTLTMGTHPGTVMGEMVRSMFQFKTFTTTFLARSVGREFLRGPTHLGKIGGVDFNVSIPGIVQLMMGTTFFGGISLMLYDLLTGKNPMDRINRPGAFFGEAMATGGGLGIFGDVLLGKQQYGYGLPQVIAGPVLGNLDEISSIFKNFTHGEFRKIPAEAGRLLSHSVPYANLFYFDLAMKHLFFYGMQEAMNPGYLRRMEQRARSEKQTYWLRPTEAVQF